MDVNIYHIILFFFIYSFLGWLWETIYCSIEEKKFQYRGFLVGPYCPIYGVGVLILLFFLIPLKDNIPVLFAVAFLVMSAIEYTVSYILEKLFHTRWWDYSKERFNIDGRVALRPSLFWATMSVLVVYVIQPPIHDFVYAVVAATGPWVALSIAGIMLTDTAFTVARLVGLYKLVRQLEAELERRRAVQVAHLKELVATVIDRRRSHRLFFSERRLIKAFPFAFSEQYEKMRSLRDVLLEADERNKATHKKA